MTQMMIAVMVAAGLSSYGGRIENLANTRVEAFLDGVNARPDPRERVKDLQAQLKTGLVPLAKQSVANRRALAEQWRAPSVDRLKIHAVVDRQLEDLKLFAHQAADLFISLHDVLTPEQREKAVEL